MSVLAWRVLWLLVLTIPLENIVTLPGVGSITRLVGLMAIAAGIGALAARPRLRRPVGFHIAAILFVTWAALTLFWTADVDQSATRASTYVQVLGVALLIWQFAPDEPRQHKLMSAYVCGAAIAVLWTIVNGLTGSTAFLLTGKAGYEYEERYVISGTDPNDLGLTLALAVPLAWYLAARTSSRAARNLYQLYVPAAVVAIALTGSRGAMLALAVALLIVPLMIRQLGAARLAIMGVVSGLTAYVVYAFVPPAVLTRLSTVGEQIASGSISARSNIWSTGFEAFVQHPLLGHGTGAFAQAVYGVSTGSVDQVAHNAFLSVLVEHGLIGSIVLGLALLLVTVRIPRMERLPRVLWMVMLLTLLTGASALSWEYRKPTWFLLGLLAAHGSSAAMRPARRRLTRFESDGLALTQSPDPAFV